MRDASLPVTLIVVGAGWLLSAFILAPIRRITQTARAIGEERSSQPPVDTEAFNGLLGYGCHYCSHTSLTLKSQI